MTARWRIATLLAALAIGTGAAAPQPQLVLWAWERPEDLRFAAPTEVAVQTGFVVVRGEQVLARGRRFPLRVEPGQVTTALVHVQIDHRVRLAPDAGAASRIADAVLALGAPAGARRLQLDFEARRSERPLLLAVLRELRRRLPADRSLSMTALASWCDEAWLDQAPVDEVAPMLFRMGPGGAALRRRLEGGGDFTNRRCHGALAISTDAPLAQAPAGRRVYLFNPTSWSAPAFAQISQRVQQWSAAD